MRHRIQFPREEAHRLSQDEVTFAVIEDGEPVELRFHDYDRIYSRPGLYEQVFYERLKCSSPTKVGEILKRTLDSLGENTSELRVLDLGAGNGMMGEVLNHDRVARLIGADIIEAAKQACDRDRPGIYDDYFVADFTDLSKLTEEEIDSWSINCLTSVAALGFGDIPPEAFCRGLNFVRDGGWVAFNIKETFLDASDEGGFSRMIRELIFSEYLDLFHLEKYRHRLSMDGTPLFYFALVAKKTADIPIDFLQSHGIGS